MSVIIEGIDKPSSCVDCGFMNEELKCIFMIPGTEVDPYMECPLTELPPDHGRLLDEKIIHKAIRKYRDRLIEKMTAASMERAYGVNKIGILIEALPAVIEAEV